MKKGKKLHGNKETVVKVCNWLSLPLQALGCCILYLVIEAFSRHSLASAWSYMVESPWVFLYNAFLIFTTFMVTASTTTLPASRRASPTSACRSMTTLFSPNSSCMAKDECCNNLHSCRHRSVPNSSVHLRIPIRSEEHTSELQSH